METKPIAKLPWLKRKLKSGMYLVMDQPLKFANGDEVDTFFIRDAKRRIFMESKNGCQRYSLPSKSKLANYGYNVVRDPSKHPRDKEPAQPEPREETLLFSLK